MQQSKSKNSKSSTNARGASGVVRIVGGQMRGRKLRFSTASGLRPTLDRVRETLFNWLAPHISQSCCLDLFAGSGAIGFEASSRGASEVVLVEKNAKVVKDLRANCETMAVKNIKVVNLEAQRFLQTNQQKFDLIFLDPPFGKGLLVEIMSQIEEHITDNGLVYLEQEKSDNEFVPGDEWEVIKYKETGCFSYALYRCAGAQTSI